jgi:hypothetical protein
MTICEEVEYEQISEDWRHRDNLTWQIPSVIVVIGGALIAAAFTLNIKPFIIRPVLLGLGAFLSLCLTYALAQNLWYQMGSGEALIKIANGEIDMIPTDKVRRILKPEDFMQHDIINCKKNLIKKHRLTGSNCLFYFCVCVTIILFVLLFWSIVECLMEGLSCLTFAL